MSDTVTGANKTPPGLQRVMANIEDNVKDGNFYEAHQKYKSLYFRLLRQKKYLELLNLLYNGSTLLLKNNQQTSGVDIANLYVDVLVKSQSKPTDEYAKKIAELFSLMSPTSSDRSTFLTSAVKWSMNGGNKGGSPSLHQSIAEIYWKEKNYVMARRHYLRSYDGPGFANMLVEVHRTNGYIDEVDLFIAQVVLQCLCLRNQKTAVITFECYTTQHPNISHGPPYLLPLLNFIWFLLQAVEGGRLAAFTILCDQYQLSIDRDPTYNYYLKKISQIFFGVKTPPTRSAGLFGNILQTFVQSIDEDMSNDEDDDFFNIRSSQPRQESAGTSRSSPGQSSTLANVVMDTELD